MTGGLGRLPDHAGAVELLDRSLAYTRVALAAVTDDRLGAPTPCAGWDLARLLTHMEDSLDAFGEGAAGAVRLTSTTTAPAGERVASLQRNACALLGAWSSPVPATVRVGEAPMDTSLLALAATLEITVHGWDVASSLGLDHPLPEALARQLLPVALALVTPAERGSHFADPRPPVGAAGAGALLLSYLGRSMTGPPTPDNVKPGAGPRIAS